jgi:hypothetical protein
LLTLRQLADSFTLAADAQAIGDRLIAEVPRFAHLSQARLVYLASQPTVTLHGNPCWACVVNPSVQGPLTRFFDWVLASMAAPLLEWDEPDFVVLIDAAVWSTLDALRRERLIYHELRHIVARETEYGVPKLDAEGRPMLRLVAHDIEAFEDEIATYGIEACGLEDACIAIADGLAVDRRRKTSAA